MAYRRSHRALGALALCCALPACSDELTGNGVGWSVEFACEADRQDSDQLQLIMHEGGCGGREVYSALLAKGDSAPKTDSLAPGQYGFEAIALQAGSPLAQGCTTARLPGGAAPRVLLASASCLSMEPPVELPSDAGAGPDASVGSDAAADIDAEPPPPPPVGSGDDSSVPDPCANGACVPCERSCSANQRCQNGACRPTATSANGCVARHYAGHDYLFCSDRQNWSNARRKCRSWGFGLAIIDSAEENEFIRSSANGLDRWLGANDLGANDVAGFELSFDLENVVIGQESNCKRIDGALGEGNWYWASQVADVSNDQPLCAFADATAESCSAPEEVYQNWRSGTPDNAACTCIGVCLPGQDCMMMRVGDGSWDDEACLAFVGYVCESP